MGLYHWSKQLNETDSNFFVSKCPEHKIFHEKAEKQYLQNHKSLDAKLDELSMDLSSVSISAHMRLKKVIEQQALTAPKPSEETSKLITQILASPAPKSLVTTKKKPGRPRKVDYVPADNNND